MNKVRTSKRKCTATGENPLWPNVLDSQDLRSKDILRYPDFVGVKAFGLNVLPNQWVPSFLVLTKSFHALYLSAQKSTHRAFEQLPEAEKELFRGFLAKVSREGGANAQIFVRSNSPEEDLSNRGQFRSFHSTPQVDAVLGRIYRVLTQHDGPMCVVLQAAISPGMQGHMSNERRVSSTKTRWLVESEMPLPKRFLSAKQDAHSGPLFANSAIEIIKCLQSIAGFLINKNTGYFHCEWVWSSKRLWIVQSDDASSPAAGTGENQSLLACKPSASEFVPKFTALQHFTKTDVRWKKLARPRTFKKVGLPVGNIYVLAGDALNADNDELYQDLRRMCEYPVVVRCDIGDSLAHPDLLLPTSSPISEVEQLFQFFEQTALELTKRGLSKKDWAFLLAHFVPAQASAMVNAWPHGSRIRVDALWGYPDGLNHLAHDTYFYYPGNQRIKSTRNFKGKCLIPKDGKWATCSIDAPLDWQAVLSDSEVRALGDWALRLANELGKEVQLMALARIGGIRGIDGCLPWHYTSLSMPQYSRSSDYLPSRVKLVTSYNDLRQLSVLGLSLKCDGFLLQPVGDVLRDETFIQEAARFAAKRGKPLYFQGSLLGHAYYLMAKTGAEIIPIAQDEPSGDRKTYNKLVRDRIPVIIRESGGLARVRTLEKSEAKRLLAQKLVEESFEVWNASEENINEELADVLEVIDALRAQIGISSEHLVQVQANKRQKRGGFNELIFLEDTDVQSLRSYNAELGHLPLFGEQGKTPMPGTVSTAHDVIISENAVKSAEILRFNASLVPPMERPGKPNVFVANSDSHQARVQYASARLYVSIVKRPQFESPDQLTFLNENADDVGAHE